MKVTVTFPCTFTLDVDPDAFRDAVAKQLAGVLAPPVSAHNAACSAARAARVAAVKARLRHDLCSPLPAGFPLADDVGQTLTALRLSHAGTSSAGRTAVSDALAQLVSEGVVELGFDGRYRAKGGRRQA